MPGASARDGRSLVTGGAGFIGSHLVEALLARGGEVRVLDDLSTGHRSNLPVSERLDFIEGSIRQSDVVAKAMRGVDTVFHLAAMAAVPESLENPRKCIELNDLAVFEVYQAACENKVRRLVFSSSSAVYGDIDTPHNEDLLTRPNSPYAMHKLLGEHYGLYFDEYRGLESVYLRYFNVYGPRQRPDSPYSGVISLFLDCLKRNQPGLIFDDGSQTRDFIFVEDVVRANLAAAESVGVSGRSFNIASGSSTSILDLYRLLMAISGRDELAPLFAPARAGDIRHSFGSTRQASEFLGFSAEVELSEGLRRTWDWFLELSSA